MRVCCVRVNGRGGVGRVGSSGDGGRVWLAGAVPVRWCGVVVQTPDTTEHGYMVMLGVGVLLRYVSRVKNILSIGFFSCYVSY